MSLNIPSQMEPIEGSFPRSPRKVKKWLSELQEHDIGEMTRQFYHGLKHSNRLRNEPRARIEIMELLRPTAWSVLDNLLTRYATLSLPLPEKSRRIFDLHLALLQELAFGYKIALSDEVNGEEALPIKMHLMAAERAISHLSELMLRCAQLYQPLPKSLWSDLHQLYAGAERINLQGKELRDAGLRGTAKLSVEATYKRALAFSLCSPNRLRRGEAVLLFKQLERWVEGAVLAPMSDEPGATVGLFGVCLGTNAPPSRLGFVNAPDHRDLRTLDLQALLPQVDRALQQAPESEAPILDEHYLQRSTLLCVKANWSLSNERKSGRAVRNNKALVEVGLKDIHAHLRYERKPAERDAGKTDSPADFAELQLMSLPQVERRDAGGGFITHPNFNDGTRDGQLWDSVARGKPMSRAYVEEQRKRVAARVPVKETVRQQNWTVVNVSATGFGLRWQGDGPSRAHVGEVVALREQTRDGRTLSWRVGVIRWIQFTEVNTFHCGVQLLSPRVVPVIAERRHGARAQDVSNNECLMLPELKTIKQPSTLLAPSHTFRVGDITTLRVGEKDIRVKLIEAMEQTSFFTQFHVRLATGVRKASSDQAGQTVSLPAPKTEETDEFSGLWRTL